MGLSRTPLELFEIKSPIEPAYFYAPTQSCRDDKASDEFVRIRRENSRKMIRAAYAEHAIRTFRRPKGKTFDLHIYAVESTCSTREKLGFRVHSNRNTRFRLEAVRSANPAVYTYRIAVDRTKREFCPLRECRDGAMGNRQSPRSRSASARGQSIALAGSDPDS